MHSVVEVVVVKATGLGGGQLAQGRHTPDDDFLHKGVALGYRGDPQSIEQSPGRRSARQTCCPVDGRETGKGVAGSSSLNSDESVDMAAE